MSADAPVLHGDARAEAISILTAALAGRGESYVQGAEVKGRYTGSLPTVVVLPDGLTDATYPLVDVESVRVNCWAATEQDAHDLARLARAFLLIGSSGQLRACTPGSGPFDTLDDQSGAPMSWFTVDCHMQGQLLVP